MLYSLDILEHEYTYQLYNLWNCWNIILKIAIKNNLDLAQTSLLEDIHYNCITRNITTNIYEHFIWLSMQNK
jgi:hypothetical protein